MARAIEQGATGIAAIEPCLRLKNVLAPDPIEIIHLGADHAGSEGPQAALFRMADSDDMIPDPRQPGLA